MNRIIKLRGKTGSYIWRAIRGLHVVKGDWLLEKSGKPRDSDNPQMQYIASETMWAVYRDSSIYLIRPTRDKARQEANILGLDGNSKHKWYVLPVIVAAMSDLK